MKIAALLFCFNQERFIDEALDGIRLQTRQPDEVIIADDGSSDATPQRIKDYVMRHGLSDWKLLLSPVNRGINANLQSGLDAVTTDIIVPMAGDDVSLPNRCAEAERIFTEQPGRLIIATSGWVIDETGNVIRESNHVERVVSDIGLAIRRGNPLITPVGQSWRRRLFELYGPLPLDVPNEDDQITFWGLMEGGIYCSPQKTYKYRIHNKSASAWLRVKQDDDSYFSRFIKDMTTRERHMLHWALQLNKSNVPDAKELARLAEKKSKIYQKLKEIEKIGIFDRLLFAVKNRKLLSTKEKFFFVFGRNGITTWRKIRIITGRA